RLITVLDWLVRPARVVDRAIKPRLTFMVHDSGKYLIAIICVVISISMPVLEVVPFLATAAGGALTIFGLSLVAYDGALALFAFVLTAVAVGAVLYTTL